jgi:hypothetical protein
VIATLHICVAMKPLDGNFAQNALSRGVAGLNVDGCRIEIIERENFERNSTPNAHIGYKSKYSMDRAYRGALGLFDVPTLEVSSER